MGRGTTMVDWLTLLISSLIVIYAQVHGDSNVPITVLERAIPKGAVCLDGSAPSFSYVEGSGNGSHSWIVYLQGGAWCDSMESCYKRSGTELGSSRKLIGRQTSFTGLHNLDCMLNQDFCNWHKVYINYCDGSSFMSDIEQTTTNLTFRGARIFIVMMEEMLSKE